MLRLVFASNIPLKEDECTTIVLQTPSADFDVLAAVRAACAEYSKTAEGKAVISEMYGSFDWGDFLQYVPAEICQRHGFTFADVPPYELLCTDYYEDLLAEDEVAENAGSSDDRKDD